MDLPQTSSLREAASLAGCVIAVILSWILFYILFLSVLSPSGRSGYVCAIISGFVGPILVVAISHYKQHGKRLIRDWRIYARSNGNTTEIENESFLPDNVVNLVLNTRPSISPIISPGLGIPTTTYFSQCPPNTIVIVNPGELTIEEPESLDQSPYTFEPVASGKPGFKHDLLVWPEKAHKNHDSAQDIQHAHEPADNVFKELHAFLRKWQGLGIILIMTAAMIRNGSITWATAGWLTNAGFCVLLCWIGSRIYDLLQGKDLWLVPRGVVARTWRPWRSHPLIQAAFIDESPLILDCDRNIGYTLTNGKIITIANIDHLLTAWLNKGRKPTMQEINSLFNNENAETRKKGHH